MKASVQNYSGYNKPLRTDRDFEPDQTLVALFHETNQGGQSQRVRPLAGPMTGSACPRWNFPRGHGAKVRLCPPYSLRDMIRTSKTLYLPAASSAQPKRA